jgi:hypothetical protein
MRVRSPSEGSSAAFFCSLYYSLKLRVVNDILRWQAEAIKLQVDEPEILLQPPLALYRRQRLACEKIELWFAGECRK